MTTLHEMIYHVRNTLRGGLGNDNDPVTLLQIGRWIDQARADTLLRSWSLYKYDHTLLEQDPGLLKLDPLPLQQFTITGVDHELEDRNVNTHNAGSFFYRNHWIAEIPELIGIPGHEDLKIGTSADNVLTVPIIEHSQQNFLRYLKFSGSLSQYCWHKGKVKIIPEENTLRVEIPDVQDLTLAVKYAGTSNFVIASDGVTTLIDHDKNNNPVDIYQPFLKISGIFARPTEVSGWSVGDPLALMETAKTMRYPITEALKEQVILTIKENYMVPVQSFFNDRANNAQQETDRIDTQDAKRAAGGQRGR